MGVRSFTAVMALALFIAFGSESRAANIFELNFWLSGPRYDAVVPLCEDYSVMNKISGPLCPEGKPVLEFRAADCWL